MIEPVHHGINMMYGTLLVVFYISIVTYLAKPLSLNVKIGEMHYPLARCEGFDPKLIDTSRHRHDFWCLIIPCTRLSEIGRAHV